MNGLPRTARVIEVGLSIEGYAKVKFCDHDRALARPKPMRRRHGRSTRWPGLASAADIYYGGRRAAVSKLHDEFCSPGLRRESAPYLAPDSVLGSPATAQTAAFQSPMAPEIRKDEFWANRGNVKLALYRKRFAKPDGEGSLPVFFWCTAPRSRRCRVSISAWREANIR